MKLLVSDTEVGIEMESGEVLEWTWQGGRLLAKLVRGEPYTMTPSRTVTTRVFDGVTPEMEQK